MAITSEELDDRWCSCVNQATACDRETLEQHQSLPGAAKEGNSRGFFLEQQKNLPKAA
jgi:hypothetical protein